MSPSDAIFARDLVVRYGRRTGIDGIHLTVPQGSLFGFLGPNGAGKTTAIRAFLGFLRPHGGAAQIFGQDCWKESHVLKREIGYLPGDLRLYSWMNGRSALDLVGRIRGRNLMKAGSTLFERFRLDPSVPVRRMSRGMRQKLGLILALAHGPRLLILDEPTSGLDPIMQRELESILRERVERQGATVFFSSHTLSEVESLCDRVAIIRDGQVVESASIRDLQRRASRQITVEFADEQAAARLDVPKELNNVERRAQSWIAEFEGSATVLVDWLKRDEVQDFTIGPPDLEAVFHRYYRRDAEQEEQEEQEI